MGKMSFWKGRNMAKKSAKRNGKLPFDVGKKILNFDQLINFRSNFCQFSDFQFFIKFALNVVNKPEVHSHESAETPKMQKNCIQITENRHISIFETREAKIHILSAVSAENSRVNGPFRTQF